MEHLFLMFLDHTQRRSTVARTPLDEWSARRRDLYLTTHDTHNRQISMPPVGFEPTISAGEQPVAARLLRSSRLTNFEVSRSHSHTPHSVGLLWKSDRPVADTSTWQHKTLTKDRYPCPGEIRNRHRRKRAAARPRLRPRGHWERTMQLHARINNHRVNWLPNELWKHMTARDFSIVKPTRCTIFRVYWISLYMFRTVFPSIIRSSRLYKQH